MSHEDVPQTVPTRRVIFIKEGHSARINVTDFDPALHRPVEDEAPEPAPELPESPEPEQRPRPPSVPPPQAGLPLLLTGGKKRRR
jgi:hypothetical protein